MPQDKTEPTPQAINRQKLIEAGNQIWLPETALRGMFGLGSPYGLLQRKLILVADSHYEFGRELAYELFIRLSAYLANNTSSQENDSNKPMVLAQIERRGKDFFDQSVDFLYRLGVTHKKGMIRKSVMGARYIRDEITLRESRAIARFPLLGIDGIEAHIDRERIVFEGESGQHPSWEKLRIALVRQIEQNPHQTRLSTHTPL